MFDVLVNILDGSMWVGGVVAALFLLDVQIPSWFRLTWLTRRTAFQRAVPFFLAGCILLGALILYFEKGVMRAVLCLAIGVPTLPGLFRVYWTGRS